MMSGLSDRNEDHSPDGAAAPRFPDGAAALRFARAAVPAAVLCVVISTCAAAGQLLSGLFPDGVPGYGTAPGVTVLSRAHPALDPPGIPGGGFRFWPRLDETIGYDGNVFARPGGPGSWLVRTQPSVLAASDWSRHALGAYAALTGTNYLSVPGQSRVDGTVSVGAAMDIGEDHLTLGAAHVTRHEDRTGIDALPADRPVAVAVNDARVSHAMTWGRWTLTPNAEVSTWRYGAATILGAPVSQSWRDRTVLEGGVTLRYELAPSRNLILVSRVLDQNYAPPGAGQLSADSTSYQILTGLDYDDDTVWRYRVLIGAEDRQFRAYSSRAGLLTEAEVIWTPSGLTTVRGGISRGIEDSAQEGVAGFTYTSVRLTIDHEYLRDVVVSASLGARRAVFLGAGGTQTGFSGGAGVTWLVNRWARLSATYERSAVRGALITAGASTGDYVRDLSLLTLRLGL